MTRSRFLIVSHAYESTQRGSVENGQWDNKMPVHDLVSSYHWARMDDEHIIVTADYSINNQRELHSHPCVTVLPSIYNSNVSVQDHIKQQHEDFKTVPTEATVEGRMKVSLSQPRDSHAQVARNILGKDDGSYFDLLSTLEDKFGPMFSMVK